MPTPIFDLVMDEIEERGGYKADVYEPYFIVSYAMHNFNLHNKHKKVYYTNKTIPDMRVHLIYVAPTGGAKTWYFHNNMGDEYSIFKNTGVLSDYKSSATESALVGTWKPAGGQYVRREGLFEIYKDGVIIVDEFSAFLKAMSTQTNSQMESQLLAALDHGRIRKDISSGDSSIEYDTNVTVYGGIQPTRFDASAGMARRVCFVVSVMSKEDDNIIGRRMHKTRNMKPNQLHMREMWDKIKRFNSEIKRIENVTFDDSILQFYERNEIYSYERPFYDRLFLGWTLARDGGSKQIEVNTHDTALIDFIDTQIEWRKKMTEGIDLSIVVDVIKEHGGEMKIYDLVSVCARMGWNSDNVIRMIRKLTEIYRVKQNGATISLL